MTHTVQLPNGQSAQFPDEMSQEQIESILHKQFPPISQANNVLEPELSSRDQFKNHLEGLLGMGGEGFASKEKNPLRHLAAGAIQMAKGIGNALPDMFAMGKGGEELRGIKPTIDPYQATGVEESKNILSPEGLVQSIPSVAGAFAMPELKAGQIPNALASMGRLGKMGANAITRGIPQGLYGSTQTEDPNVGFTLGLLGEPVAKGIGKAVPYTFSAIKNAASIIPKALSSVTPKVAAQTVQGAHDVMDKQASKLFSTVEKGAESRGVNIVPIDQALINEVKLPITEANKKLIKDARTGDYKAIKDLQTDLWKRGTKAMESDLQADRNLGEEMLDLRDRINGSVSDHFIKTGNKDLSETLQEARGLWRNIKETYYTDPTIAKLVGSQRKTPKNIITKLSEDSAAMEKLRQSNPLIMKNVKKALDKQKSLKTLGKLALPGFAAYEIGKNVFSE